VIPGINLAHEALRMIDFIAQVYRIAVKLYPFITQVERKLSQDVSSIQNRVEEIYEHDKHTNL
jgi:hypothetical protein